MNRQEVVFVSILGVAHGIADCMAGWLLASLPYEMDLMEIARLVLIYNICGFLLQPAAGWVTDYLKIYKWATVFGLLCIAASLLMRNVHLYSVIVAGIGSSFFHVGGGGMAITFTKKKALGPGIFAAPGVLGLGIGGFLAIYAYEITTVCVTLAALLIVLVCFFPQQQSHHEKSIKPRESFLDGHDIIMLAIITAIALRSAIWLTMQSLYAGEVHTILFMAIAAGIGKLIGGIVADYVGWKNWVYFAATSAAILLTIERYHQIYLLIGVGLLQSTTPVLVVMIAQYIPKYPALCAGLTFGLAIVLGSIPYYLGWSQEMSSPLCIVALTMAMLVILWHPANIRKEIRK
ncbi:hypothetical protein [Candidatus Uabimicrobium amorphum]|uniref:MFS transporter n=1 Tax=Uabimicrobium amorphum TaxID=2596890 RepID=A0A5S9IJS9_UABAM|nr:hypothetical protein [Candidatus Uabimicrobium amorphum]BBM82350.1 MFS transporter [Candidatus Uabimicrobium amorphum]